MACCESSLLHSERVHLEGDLCERPTLEGHVEIIGVLRPERSQDGAWGWAHVLDANEVEISAPPREQPGSLFPGEPRAGASPKREQTDSERSKQPKTESAPTDRERPAENRQPR